MKRSSRTPKSIDLFASHQACSEELSGFLTLDIVGKIAIISIDTVTSIYEKDREKLSMLAVVINAVGFSSLFASL